MDEENELDENKLKFETEKNENEAKLADAKRQLDDAHITLVTYKAQITSLNSAISSLEKTVKSYQDTLDYKKEELGISDEQIQNKMNEIENIDVQTILNMLGSGLDSFINGSDNVYELDKFGLKNLKVVINNEKGFNDCNNNSFFIFYIYGI